MPEILPAGQRISLHKASKLVVAADWPIPGAEQERTSLDVVTCISAYDRGRVTALLLIGKGCMIFGGLRILLRWILNAATHARFGWLNDRFGVSWQLNLD
jgi:Uncharacterized protein conserved in bacteria